MIDIFIAYSHNDLEYKNELKKFLRPLLNAGQVRLWDDYDIEYGKDWDAEIKTRLYGAHIILLLVSPDSLASDYFYGKEVTVSLERHEKGETVVVPVILRSCMWTITPLGKIEAMPDKGKPVNSPLWGTKDDAYTNIAQGIGELVDRLLEERSHKTQEEETLRRFTAAVEAAGTLYDKSNWPEALKAYSEALTLHRAGFKPEAATLRHRIGECKQKQQEDIDNQAFEAQKAEFERRLIRAGTLFAQQNWREALSAYQEALVLYDPKFPATEANSRINERIAACEAALKPPVKNTVSIEKTVRVETPAQPSATSGNNRMLYSIAGIVAVLIFAIVLILKPWKNNNPEPARTDFEKKEAQPVKDDNQQPHNLTPLQRNGGEEAFQNAKTIPALEAFLQKYPSDKNAVEAKRQLGDLQKNRTAWLVTAALNLEDKDFLKARVYYNKVLSIDPNNAEARQKLDKIKGR